MTTPDDEGEAMFEAKGPISDRLREQLDPNDPAWTPKRIPDSEIYVDPEVAARAEVTPLGETNRVTEETM